MSNAQPRRNVLVTGSSKGIGAATALAFARAGCNVGVNYCKTPAGAEAVAAEIRALGMDAEVYAADVGVAAQSEKLVQDFVARFGRIDVLINNAGGALTIPRGGFEELPPEYWDSQIALNLSAAAYTSRAAMRDMIPKRTRGKIINISSIHGLVTFVRRKALPYCAAKAGLNMLTKALGVEAIKHGINVNCVAPGFIATQATKRWGPKELEGFKRKIPAGFLGCVDDVTPLILFLADDEKARFIVGQTFVVDGGQSIDGAIDFMLDTPL